MKRFACAAILLAGAYGVGCDDTPAPPPELVKEAAPRETPEARPATRELLEGPRKPIALGVLPLTVRAPAGWSVKTMEGTSVTLLEGPTPGGDASIQLSDRAPTTAAKFDAIVSGAKREMQQHPESIKMAELRTIAGAKVLERQRVGRMPAPTAEDEAGVKPSPVFSWTITVFVPRGADYETYELNFIGLTADQYDADRALLRGIIDSITVDAATAPAAAAP